jgi:T-complex protein 1 subunit delta
MAFDKAVEMLKSIAIPVDLADRDALIRAAVTSLNSKVVSAQSGQIAPIAVDAVRALFPVLAADIDAGRQRLTDSRGLPVEATQALVGGSIYRVVPVRERVDAAAEPGDVEVTS